MPTYLPSNIKSIMPDATKGETRDAQTKASNILNCDTFGIEFDNILYSLRDPLLWTLNLVWTYQGCLGDLPAVHTNEELTECLNLQSNSIERVSLSLRS